MTEIATFLKGVSIFSTLNDSDLEKIAGQFKLLDFEANAEIVRQGQPSDTLLVVKEGFINVMRTGEGGKSAFLTVLSAKDYLGEASLFEGIARTANIVAASKVQILVITKVNLDGFFKANPEAFSQIVYQILKQVLIRLSMTSKDLLNTRATGIDQDTIDKLLR